MEQPVKWFEEHKFIAVIRSSSAEDAEKMIESARKGGFCLFEISMQTPQVTRLLETYAKKTDCFVGAGNVSDGEMAQRAINAGARFISSQYTDRDLINVAKHNESFVIQGAITPTEAVKAHSWGADLVKIYPVQFFGGASYLKYLRGPHPFLKLVAEGEITHENAFDYLKYSVAVSIGKSVFDKSLLRANNWAEITERSRQLCQKLETVKVSR